MATLYTTPVTHVAGYVPDENDWNELVNDIKESAPAKAATAGRFIRVVGLNEIEEADLEDGAKLDGDHLDIDYTPTNYTPSTAPAEAADVDDLAAHLQGIDTALTPFVVANCQVTDASTQVITANTWTTVAFDTEVADTDAFHSTVTNNSRMTFPASRNGVYVITFNCLVPNGSNNSTMCRLLLNGVAIRYGAGYAAGNIGTSEDGGITFASIETLAVTDYIEIQVDCEVGITIDKQTFSIAKVG